jgi:hypothetical protein
MEDEMDKACSTKLQELNPNRILVEKPEGRRPLRKTMT